MSQWVRTDYQYEPRITILTISGRDAYRAGKLNLASLTEQGKPEEIERIVRDLIEKLRPDLAGGVIYAIHYNLCPPRWEITYIHPSLEPVQNVQEAPRIPIIPE
jgi:hypothetical protein